MLIEQDAIWHFATLEEQGRIVIAESSEHVQGSIIKPSSKDTAHLTFVMHSSMQYTI